MLGRYLGKLWIDEYGASAAVVGQTKTENNHAMLKSIGIRPTTVSDDNRETFPYVAFCAPPSGSDNYPEDLRKALQRWDGTGNFVFTSSAGVYAVNDGSNCDEASPVMALGANPRMDALLMAENAVVEAGGCVVRLVGLYHRTRGPHTFFLKQGEVPRWGGYTVNMIHYEDAAGISAAILKGQGSPNDGKYRSKTFVGCDDLPVTFQDMMDAIAESGQLPGKVVFTEAQSPDNLGKLMSNDASRQELNWSPKYPSIIDFFKVQHGKDWYAQQEKITHF